jgi:hypothetical protein
MIKYIVRFRYYKYNSGRGDNGYYLHEVNFDSLAKADVFAREVNCLDDSHKWLVENFRINGFVEKCLGIYRVTDELVSKTTN